MALIYRYVGPAAIRDGALKNIHRTQIGQPEVLKRWIEQTVPDQKRRAYVPATFVVDTEEQLWIADRRSEHVACAAGGDVLAAGEVVFFQSGEMVEVIEATNQSTGYCPQPDCWFPLVDTLNRIGISHPGGFTSAFDFRRCDSCGMITLIKDDAFHCVVCDSMLSRNWNF